MAPHTPQRSSRPGEAGPRLDPHTPQRSSRPGEAGPRLENYTTSSVREVASPKRPIEYPGSPA